MTDPGAAGFDAAPNEKPDVDDEGVEAGAPEPNTEPGAVADCDGWEPNENAGLVAAKLNGLDSVVACSVGFEPNEKEGVPVLAGSSLFCVVSAGFAPNEKTAVSGFFAGSSSLAGSDLVESELDGSDLEPNEKAGAAGLSDSSAGLENEKVGVCAFVPNENAEEGVDLASSWLFASAFSSAAGLVWLPKEKDGRARFSAESAGLAPNENAELGFDSA
ncbi:hypothetical protein OGATHE_000598 [Ogataea polymorpha]|uniref:Uncharacterized protein n=1 Tax=Ogataea polymorpha TaxID=460523 RepID=A0A9P8TFS3_9ASCO|nr:hypothetical protein OGATHE_000598 [Ogataea polymorpha]